jgi:cytochrome c oxidase subunit 2
MWQNFPLWPTEASTMSTRVDALMVFLIAISAFFITLIFVFLAIFAIKYRRSRRVVAEQIGGSWALEITWTLIPFAITMAIFVWGASIYLQEAQPPKDSLQIFVVAKQWMWKFEHSGGQREINELHVPVNQDVRLTMISQDVIHSLFVPAFRVKQDVLPARYTTLWFHATKPGRYHLFCTQYCGTLHSGMIGEVVVMKPEDYQAWLALGGAEGSMATTGEKLFQELGCSTCHRSDTQGRGPNLAGLYGRRVLLSDGTTVVADDNYIRESILNPGAQVVAGFQPIMPTFQGVVTEEQLLSVIAYIKSLAQPEQRGPISNPPALPQPSPNPR